MAIDLLGDLVSLGVISREHCAAAAAVSDNDARTILGKLVVVGVDADDVVAAAADIVGLPVATREMLQRAYVVDAVPAASAPLLRERLALPVAQDGDGVIDVVVAAPEAAAELAALGLPRCRVFLGAERSLVAIVDSVLPLPRRGAGADTRDAVANGAQPALDAAESSGSQARQKAEAAARVAASAARAGASAALTALKEHGAPAAQALFEKTAETSGAVARQVVEKARGRERVIAAGAGGVLLVVVIGVAVHCATSRVNEVEVKQQAALVEARAKRDAGEVAWAIAGFSRVVDLAPHSPLALQALYERAIVEKNDGDIGNAYADLRMLIADPDGDPALLAKARAAQAEMKAGP